jgi:Mlc titration factor MtfA (ptsG expression regulator)
MTEKVRGTDMWSFRSFRRRRILRKASMDEELWRRVVRRFAFLRGLSREEIDRLRSWVILFLHEKKISAAGGLDLDERMRLSIALQACILILNLDLDYYRGWVDVVVYPDEFIPTIEYTDEAGVVHTVREPTSGESWESGPVILSWADVDWSWEEDGYNVVIHEFAHKLDMLGGEADGCPPLHRGMDAGTWARVFTRAYEDFCDRVDHGEDTLIDPYAADSPTEFFAVMSETFFLLPDAVKNEYPAVYDQLSAFYRQDPAARHAHGAR